jgi:hypothetical protein
MAEQIPFPKTLFSKDEQQNQVKDSATGEVLCGSKIFHSQEEVDAAGGTAVWKETPQEASQSQPRPQPGQQPQPGPQPPDPADDEGTPPPPRRR